MLLSEDILRLTSLKRESGEERMNWKELCVMLIEVTVHIIFARDVAALIVHSYQKR